MSISIDLARKILDASKRRARELRSPVSIAIVDAGGHLVLFERMMAPYAWATGDICIAKAHTAVMFNQTTDSVAQWASAIPGFSASLANMTGGKFILAAGGWPIRVNGITVGGIGVSGGNAPNRDDEIARAGLMVLDEPPARPQPPQQPPQQPSLQPEPVPYVRDASGNWVPRDMPQPPATPQGLHAVASFMPAQSGSESQPAVPYAYSPDRQPRQQAESLPEQPSTSTFPSSYDSPESGLSTRYLSSNRENDFEHSENPYTFPNSNTATSSDADRPGDNT